MTTLPQGLMEWATKACDFAGEQPAFSVVAGDASSRRYFRARWSGGSLVLVDSPPATEKNDEFMARRSLLRELGIRVPDLLSADPGSGYFALEDLGDSLLLDELDAERADALYEPAFGILEKMARWPGGQSVDADFPRYDTALFSEEFSRFPEWFVSALLGYRPGAEEQRMLDALRELFLANSLAQPQVLVHRDFHSRNLMCLPGGELALIDYQDAVLGPVTYDLVSLTRDCYIRWPQERVRAWALAYRDRLVAAALLAPVEDEVFLRWHDLQGLQRHIKVLGTFARLYLRDDKAAYLDDLPLVVAYVRDICAAYADAEAQVADFHRWFTEVLGPCMAAQDWSHSE